MEYIKFCCFVRVFEYLVEYKNCIFDVVLNFGFVSYEIFICFFKKVYGLILEKYRVNLVKFNYFIKLELILNYVMVDEGVLLIVDDIVIEVNCKILSNLRIFVGIEIEVFIC